MKKFTPHDFEELSISARAELLSVFQKPEDVTEDVVHAYMIMKRQELWFEKIHDLIQHEHSRTKQHVREGVGQYQQNILNRLNEIEENLSQENNNSED